MAMLKADLEANVACHGAWVEHKDLLVAWHYREVEKSLKTTLMAKAKEIYSKHDFKVLPISKRFENEPPMGWDRGDSCIHILKWIFGLDWEERVKVCKICIRAGTLFRNKRFMLDEMFQRNASKFGIYIRKTQSCFFRFSFRATFFP